MKNIRILLLMIFLGLMVASYAQQAATSMQPSGKMAIGQQGDPADRPANQPPVASQSQTINPTDVGSSGTAQAMTGQTYDSPEPNAARPSVPSAEGISNKANQDSAETGRTEHYGPSAADPPGNMNPIK